MTLRPRDRIALAAVVFLVLAGAYYLLALKPEQRKAKSLDASIATQRQALSSAQQAVAQGRASQVALRAKAAQWSAVSRAVPAQADIPALLRTLQRAADTEHVKVGAVTLSGGAPGATTATPTGASTAGGATPVAIQLTFTGSYLALQAMLKRIDGFVVVSGSNVRATGPLVNVASLQLSGSGNLTTQLSATLYQLGGSASTPVTSPTPGRTGTGSGSTATASTSAKPSTGAAQ